MSDSRSEPPVSRLPSPVSVPGWPRASGYSNGMLATGRVIVTAGMIGWNPITQEIETDNFASQVAQTLRNIVAVLSAADAGPEHLVRLTWYVTNRDEYLAARQSVGLAYREILGKHYPVMAVVVVSALLEPRAKVEIEATAVIPAAS
ncbi:MAG: RidA family protein [Gemmatimonadaceae bacterium]